MIRLTAEQREMVLRKSHFFGSKWASFSDDVIDSFDCFMLRRDKETVTSGGMASR